MNSSTMTIGRLAKAAGVGVETVRYYQGISLLPVPVRQDGYRQYPASLVDRIGFIKRAQELGFTLEEIRSLLRLEDGSDHESVRDIANSRLHEIDAKLEDLNRMRTSLRHLIQACEETDADVSCPIIESLKPRV